MLSKGLSPDDFKALVEGRYEEPPEMVAKEEFERFAGVIAKALSEAKQSSDQAVNGVSESLTTSLKSLETSLERLQGEWEQSRKGMEAEFRAEVKELAKQIPTVPKPRDYSPDIQKTERDLTQRLETEVSRLGDTMRQLLKIQQDEVRKLHKEIVSEVAALRPAPILGMKIYQEGQHYEVEFEYEAERG